MYWCFFSSRICFYFCFCPPALACAVSFIAEEEIYLLCITYWVVSLKTY